MFREPQAGGPTRDAINKIGGGRAGLWKSRAMEKLFREDVRGIWD